MIIRKWRNGVFGGDIQPEFHACTWSGLGKLTMVVFIVLVIEAFSVTGLNADGFALLEFKNAITSDPQNALRNWNYGSDATPCSWTGISCRAFPGIQEGRVVDITLPRCVSLWSKFERIFRLAWLFKFGIVFQFLMHDSKVAPGLFSNMACFRATKL